MDTEESVACGGGALARSILFSVAFFWFTDRSVFNLDFRAEYGWWLLIRNSDKNSVVPQDYVIIILELGEAGALCARNGLFLDSLLF